MVRRFFLVFSVSLSLFTLFLFVVFYTTVVKEINDRNEFFEVRYVSSYLNSIYISAKYDLQNIVRDGFYKPLLPLVVYNKQSKEIERVGGGDIGEDIKRFLYENISSVVFLEDGFGYLPPYALQDRLNVLLLLEKGDNIYIVIVEADIPSTVLNLCVTGIEQLRGRSNIECDSTSNRERRLLDLRAYEFRYNRKDVSFAGSFILLGGLCILIGLVFSFWVSRHFDLEEQRLISEINSAIENVISGRIHLVNVRSIYRPFVHIVEGINKLITEMSSQIDKYKFVYDEHFRVIERDKAISESYVVIMNYLSGLQGSFDMKDIIKALDNLLRLNGGGLRYIGEPRSDNDLRVPVHLIMDLVRTKKIFKLILEFRPSSIEIRSENNDFDKDELELISFLVDKKIELGSRNIIINVDKF